MKPRMTPAKLLNVNGTGAGHEALNPASYMMTMMMMMVTLAFSLGEFNFQYIIWAYRVTRAF